MSGKVIQLTDANFQSEVRQSSIPVVVDFYADWCGPCKKVTPIITELAEEYAGKVKICKLDVDTNTEAAGEFGIRSIPTVKVFKGGEEVDSKTGYAAKEAFAQMIDKHL
ncbi:thioredoxin [Thermodesulfobacteriota bacterium]